MTVNKTAQKLGRMAKGKPKRFSQAYRKVLSERLSEARKVNQSRKK